MENQNTACVYVSYSRRADYSFIQTLLSTLGSTVCLQTLVVPESDPASMQSLTKQVPQNRDLDQWELVYDEKGLDAFGSIARFMEQLSEAESVIILLSPGYFQSPYCLTELLLLYTKRAEDLIPIVVFVDGYQPGAVDVAELAGYWHQQGQQAEQENKAAAANRYAEFSQMLPVILAWLLGSFDQQMQGWDTLFPVVVVDDQQTAAKDVRDALENPLEPRFAYYSAEQKTGLIEEEIGNILNRKEMEGWLQSFKAQFLSSSVSNPKLAAWLARQQTADNLSNTLSLLSKWLDAIVRDSQPSTQRQLLSGNVKEILGYLLLTAIDDGRLHQLIHQLNRLQEQASLELFEENETPFQMIVSAVALSPVLYRFNSDPASEVALQGDGQLELLDKGCTTKNYYDWLGDEMRWLDVHNVLYHQMIAHPRTQNTESALHEAIDLVLCDRKGFYLRFDKTRLDLCKNYEFRKNLGERFPDIQQVIPADEDSSTVKYYYLDGMKSGGLDERIYTIYQFLHELAQ